MHNLYVSDLELTIIKGILGKYARNFKVSAFGSRVSGDIKPTSDLDLFVEIKNAKDSDILFTSMKEDFELSDLPFRVDLVKADDISDEFRKEISEGLFLIQD